MDHMLTRLVSDWSPLAVVAKLLWMVQLGLIVHVLKTGRPYFWFWILFSAPVLGGIAYALVELAPDMRGVGGSFNWKPRSWRIRDLRAELKESDTVKLRLALASELMAARQPAEACQAADECLT